MGYCTHCGHALGIGRFCTNCGQPIPGRHEGVPAASAAPAPDAPPDAPPQAPPPAMPPATRYPLYADDPPPGPRPTAPPTVTAPPVHPAVVPTVPRDPSSRPPAWLLWAVLALVVALVLVVVLVVVLRGDEEPTAKDPGRASAATSQGRSADSSPPTSTDGGGAAAPATADDVTTLVARIAVPGTAAASTDARTGEPVTFEPAHLTDGDPTTCWRVDGDASGTSLTITFSEPVRLTEVGMVNGYAKSYPGYDGYLLNRRVLAVHWVLDDGTSVTQRLGIDRGMQTVPVDGAGATRQLRLEIDAVSPPGDGPLGKDYTAISELHLVGATA